MKNLIGNGLIILIFLMSCFFFAAALMVGAAQRNWKAEVADLTARAESAERQVNDAKSATGEQLKAIEREKVARAQQLANLFSQRRQLNEQLKERNEVLRAEIESNQERLTSIREAQARLKKLTQELAAEKAASTDLKNNISEQFAKVTELTKMLFEQQNQIEVLEQANADMTTKLSLSTKVLRTNGLDINQRTAGIVPKLTATIVQIGTGRKTFAIKLGSDDGIRGDHEFDIYRSNRFIARAVVTKVREDIAVLKLVEGFTQSPIQEGDYVTSEL